MEENIALLEFENNPNIGLYMFVNDHFALIGCNVDKKKKQEIENILKVPIYNVKALGTDLLGIFITGNNDKLIIPELYEHEIEEFVEITKKHGMELIQLKDKLNTFGNNMCVLDDMIIINQNYNKNFIDKLKKQTKLNIVKLDNKEFSSPGAIGRYLNNKLFLSQEIDEKQAKEFIDKVGGVGTINSGSPFIGSGVIGNKNGLLIGSQCSTVEIQNVLEGFNFL